LLKQLVKGRYNRGLESNLYFWRDNTGNEIDVIVEQGARLLPIEIKSGQTLTQGAFTGLRKWLSLAGDDAGKAYLCFGGDEGYERSGITVVSWKQIGDLVI
jgi:predicted AAA+ superfamily ATPase